VNVNVVTLEILMSGCRYISSVHPWEWILCFGVSWNLVSVRAIQLSAYWLHLPSRGGRWKSVTGVWHFDWRTDIATA